MKEKIKALANRMTGKAIGIVGILTMLLLLGAAAMLTLDMVSSLLADSPGMEGAVAAVESGATAASGGWAGKTLLTLALIFGLAVIAPCVGAASLFALLKRYGGQMGPLIHIEYGAPPSVVVGPIAARQVGISAADLDSLADAVERKRRLEGVAVAVDNAPTREPFDFGPTFEELHQAKQSDANRQESAVLAQVFADNLSLQEQIELDNEPEKSHEAATEINT